VHLITLREILRDADVAHVISSVVREHHLSAEQTEQALIDLHIPRAGNVARISLSLGS
jgi:hypothetical protein